MIAFLILPLPFAAGPVNESIRLDVVSERNSQHTTSVYDKENSIEYWDSASRDYSGNGNKREKENERNEKESCIVIYGSAQGKKGRRQGKQTTWILQQHTDQSDRPTVHAWTDWKTTLTTESTWMTKGLG